MRVRGVSCAASVCLELERVGPQSCLLGTRAADPGRISGNVLLSARTPRDSSEGVSGVRAPISAGEDKRNYGKNAKEE
jgi:hypothetical protein